MKLHKILEVAMPAIDDSSFDAMTARDQENVMPSERDKRIHDRERIQRTPRRNSNVKKAARIRNAVKMLKRERSHTDEVDNIDNGETPSQSSLGGHGSSFLNR